MHSQMTLSLWPSKGLRKADSPTVASVTLDPNSIPASRDEFEVEDKHERDVSGDESRVEHVEVLVVFRLFT